MSGGGAAVLTTDCDSDSNNPKSILNQRRRTGLLIFSILYTVFYVGAFFGWGPMQLLLEDHGSFADKCSPPQADDDTNNNQVCPEQTAALLNVHFIGQLTQITSPVLGYIADHYGAPVLAICMTASCWLGLILLLIATIETSGSRYDPLLYAAFVCLGLTTWMGGLLSVQTGLYFTGRARYRVIFVLNALFDAGSVTYLGLWGVSEWSKGNVSLTAIVGGYTVGAVFVMSGAVYFWKIAVPDHVDDNVKNDEAVANSLVVLGEAETVDHGDDKSREEAAAPFPVDVPESTYTNVVATPETDSDPTYTRQPIDTEDDGDGSIMDAPSRAPVLVPDESDGQELHSKDDDSVVEGDEEEPAYIIVAERTSRKQLTSKPNLLLLVFFALHLSSNQWNLTTQRDFLGSLGDDDNKYLTIFTLLMPASIVGLPFVDAVITRYGFVGGLQCINILALIFNVIKVSSDSLEVQVSGFVIFSFFRGFLFSVTLSVLPVFLGQKVVGKAAGFMYFTGGVLVFLNIPLKDWAVKGLDGDFFAPNMVYTLLVLPCVVAAWGIGRALKLDEDAKAAKLEEKLSTLGSPLVEDGCVD